MPDRRIEIDTLEYTRQGLRTREPLELATGQHHRIVLARPQRVAVRVPGVQGFPKDSSFPLLGTLEVFWASAEVGAPFTHHERQASLPESAAVQIFGHASASGDEAHNKSLSERRARVGLALLTSDSDTLTEVADTERWDTAEFQATLRTLSCDPGPIDGEIGTLTNAAVATFAKRYAAGVYHRRHDTQPREDLSADASLGECKAALFDAFVSAHGSALSEPALHPTHPTAGCSEYNSLAARESPRDRRLTLVAHPTLPRHHANAPCTEGDHLKCAVVDNASQRCMWYREHVEEQALARAVFCDPRWLWLGDDRYMLSSLTTLGDGEPVEFEVYEAQERLRGPQLVESANLGRRHSSILPGLVRHGVAQVVWKTGMSVSMDDGRPAFDDHPVFRVRDPHSSQFTFCPWPERQTLRLIIAALSPEMTDGRPKSYRLRAADGSYERVVGLSEAVVRAPQYTVLDFPDVPLDVRVSLTLLVRDQPVWDLIHNKLASALPGNCESGDHCRDLPTPTPPPPMDAGSEESDVPAVELSYVES